MEHLVTVCHCPNCGKIYHFGKYRIESGGDILCHRETAECFACGEKGLPFPKLFQNVDDVANFYKKLGDADLPMALAPCSSIELAFVDPKYFNLSRQ
jgi:hypothetical protein